ncbi:agamous-like MADS-box protein AGL66 [Solanum dulcamara]|uniref:agamous-like MADS-box protein AGL66 n=1 Tax=Solanum dulcamara TaxID=45834 RepID=UPI002485C1CD|nr:agamous-like MADS-box protein AGL66 [Solanum dulcamara]
MGRKIEIKKIEEPTKRQVTFFKRSSSLLKKAKEIAICCDVDVLFVVFSPAHRLNKFCSQRRIEDMLQRYVKLPVERRLTHMDDVQEKVAKLRQLNHIKGDVSKIQFLDKQIENLELHIKKSTLELQILDANIRDYEPAPEQEPSLYQLNWCERNLHLSLQKVMARKMELEKQEKTDVHFAAQQTAPQQFDTNNWINPYSSSIQGNIYENWMDKRKRVANSSRNYTYISSFASSSQSGNRPFSQIQNSSHYIPWQSQQQNMVVDVQQNPAQTFGQSQSQQENMIVDVQQNPTQIFGQSQAQVNIGESSDNSIMSFCQNLCDSTRPISSSLATTGTQLNNPSQLGLEYVNSAWNNNFDDPSQLGLENAHSNWNENFNNNNNMNNSSQLGLEYANSTWNNNFNNPSLLGLENAHSNWNDNFNNNNNNNNLIIQQNDHSSVHSDAIALNVNGFNYSIEENIMESNEYFVENTHDNDAWEWDDIFLNEAFNGEDFEI